MTLTQMTDDDNTDDGNDVRYVTTDPRGTASRHIYDRDSRESVDAPISALCGNRRSFGPFDPYVPRAHDDGMCATCERLYAKRRDDDA